MPVIGGEQWAMSCTLNLASCRVRAESLARQLHSKLWSPRADDGSISPCFGLPPTASVVDTPPLRFSAIEGRYLSMSSLDDDDECPQPNNNSVDITITPPMHMSPPYSPTEAVTTTVMRDLFISRESGVWRPDSPPESSSDQHSDSPSGTVEDHSTDSNSTETVSEVASPTFDHNSAEKGSTLADELFSRLKQFQSLQYNGRSVSSPQDDLAETDLPCNSKTSSEASSTQDFLSPDSIPRLIRSTSLKTGKTPPGTPSRKKIVRFADVLGLDLEAVRHFAQDDDTPIVPQSAFADLRVTPTAMPNFSWSMPGHSTPSCRFVPQFQQPVTDPHFLEIVRQQKVCLENVIANELKATCIVRVLNLGFEKTLHARYTTTEWAAYEDFQADYVPHSCDGFSDKFSFTINLPHLCPGQRLLFALRYMANGQEFWDNNQGNNYVLRCQANDKKTESGSGNAGPKWLHHFM